MKMIRTKVNNGYGGIQDRYINPDKIRAIGNTRDGTTVWFDEGCMVVLDSASELAKQWEQCNDELMPKESEAK